MRQTLVALLFTTISLTALAPEAWAQGASADNVEDALGSKLFLGPTGRSLGRGQGYFALDALAMPTLQVGVTDRFSLGIGLPFYGLVGAAYLTPKFQMYRSEQTAVAAGLVPVFIKDFDGGGGFAYVSTTHGSADNAVTVGGAWLYGGDDGGAPMFLVGGEHRIGRRTKIITENYIFNGGVIATVGTRFMRPVFTFEAGAIVGLTTDFATPPGFFVNLVWHSRPVR